MGLLLYTIKSPNAFLQVIYSSSLYVFAWIMRVPSFLLALLLVTFKDMDRDRGLGKAEDHI